VIADRNAHFPDDDHVAAWKAVWRMMLDVSETPAG